MPTIDADLVKALTPTGLLLLLVLLLIAAFLTGLIRPRSAIKEVREDRDARLADKDTQIRTLQEAFSTEREARMKTDEALREALESSRVTAAAFTAIRSAAQDARRGDGPTS